ncbi:MAG TPA: hypothetical protein VFF06_10235 [Polyangia bacterium]|nr:hypothetical protein [Polyangia bacterium]
MGELRRTAASLAVAAWAWSAPALAKDKTCVVEGRAVEPFTVEVAARRGPVLKLRVEKVAAVAHPPEEPGPARVEIHGALDFEASAPWDQVPYTPSRFVDATNGMVRLAPGVEGLAVRARGKWAEADVTLGGVRLRGVILPCDALTLDAVARPELESAPRDENAWNPSGKLLRFRSGPGSGATLDVEVAAPADLELRRTEKSGAWARVSSHWLDGTTLTGWVKQSDLTRASPRANELGDLPPAPQPCKREPELGPGMKLAQAIVAAGTLVKADRLFEWATVRAGDKLTVRYRPQDSWVEIVGVAGITTLGECPEHSTVLDEAWVPRGAVQLPSEAPPANPPPANPAPANPK